MTKLALITGASRGLGAALAETLAPTHHIVAVGRTTGALEELDDRIQAAGIDFHKNIPVARLRNIHLDTLKPGF